MLYHRRRRQIFSFAKKGAFVGLADLDRWHFTAEAVDHVILKTIPRSALEQLLAVDISLRQEIREYVSRALAQRERQLLALVSQKAPERLLEFLSEYSASRPGNGHVAIPMSRRDIADHLGLSLETVSRAFSELKRKGAIDLASFDKYKVRTENRTSMQTSFPD